MEKVFEENSPLLCPQCGRVLQEREGRFGKFLGCTGYPDCRYTRNLEKSYG
jgi:ssDNA-binding Zn-finger/Zn-ribbon topoisomerase 1